jgi:hypothetical protein
MNSLNALIDLSIAKLDDELDGKVLTRPALLLTDGENLVYAVDVDISAGGEPLKNVPLARANKDLLYADVGNPCRLRRTDAGRWEVIGFSKEMPGTYIRFPVSLVDLSFGPVENLTLDSRGLTYAELITYGGYGLVPYGAIGIFKGGILQEISS